MKRVVIIIKANGELILSPLLLDERGNVYQRTFNCGYCGKVSNAVGSQGPQYVQGVHSYVLFEHDPHDRYDICLSPYNVHSDILLATSYEKEYNHYRGVIILVKRDPTNNTVVDCVQEDIDFVNNELFNSYKMKNEYRKSYLTRFKEWMYSLFR